MSNVLLAASPVLHNNEVKLVDWLDEGSSIARPVFLDMNSKVVFSVAARIPLERLSDYQVLYPDVGIRMRKVPAAYRDMLPAFPLRIMEIWRNAGLRTCVPASIAALCGDACFICTRDRSMDTQLIHTCSLCLMSCHTR
jgi:hypothetical protein